MRRSLATNSSDGASRPLFVPLPGIPDEAWPHPQDGVVHLWLADLDRDRFAAPTLSAEESDRARRFKAPLHQERFAQGRTLLRHLAGKYLRCDPGEIRFGYGAAGKPRILSDDHPMPMIPAKKMAARGLTDLQGHFGRHRHLVGSAPDTVGAEEFTSHASPSGLCWFRAPIA